MLGLCSYTIIKMIKSESQLWLMIGIIGCFSIGYYVLPIFFKNYSGLANIESKKLAAVCFMALIFFVAIVFGAIIGDREPKKRGDGSLFLSKLDKIFIKNYKLFFILSLIVWIGYYFTADLTSYSAEDYEAYFHERSQFAGLLAAFSNMSLSLIAVCLAIAIRKRENVKLPMMLTYAAIILMLLVTGQRLAAITPVFTLVVALSIYVDYKVGLKVIWIGVLFLILISPLMVFVREFQGDRGKAKALTASKMYKADSNPLNEGFVSIIERADLLYVMTILKERYDNNDDFDHGQYLYSVFCAYIPKFIFPDKPYALSDDGTMYGEISVQAWQLIVGNSTGSLSAFGSISAYREGGWLWVIINGFVTGYLFAWVSRFLAKGGHISRLLFVSIFVGLCIKNIPLSFFYFLVYIAPTMLLVVFLFIINEMLKSY